MKKCGLLILMLIVSVSLFADYGVMDGKKYLQNLWIDFIQNNTSGTSNYGILDGQKLFQNEFIDFLEWVDTTSTINLDVDSLVVEFMNGADMKNGNAGYVLQSDGDSTLSFVANTPDTVWTRSGTTLSPTNSGDDIDGTGGYLLDNQSITNLASNGAGYWFDGVDDYISVADDANLDFGTGDFSILSQTNPNGDGMLVKKYSGTTGYIISQSSNTIRFDFGDGTGDALANKLLMSNSDEDEYNNIGLVFDRDAGLLGYMNGEYQNTYDITSVEQSISNGASMYIGYTSNSYDGLINKIQLFNLALTATEVKDFYSNGNIPYKYIGASQTTVATYDSSQAVSDAFTLVLGKEYRWTKGSADSLVSNSVQYTTDTTFTAGATSGTAYGDLTGSDLIQIGCVANYSPDGVGHNQWIDNSGNELNGEVSGAVPVNLTSDDEQVLVIKDVTGETTKTDWLPAGYAVETIVFHNTTDSLITNLDIGFSDAGGEIVAAANVTGSSEGMMTVLQGVADIGADDTFYISADTWNSGSVDLYITIKRFRVLD